MVEKVKETTKRAADGWLEAVIDLVSSKKANVAALATGLVVFSDQVGGMVGPVMRFWGLVSIVCAWVISQGMADFGKGGDGK